MKSKIRIILEKSRLQGLLLSHQPNISYLTGFPSSDSFLLLTARKSFFITDSRYYQQACLFFRPLAKKPAQRKRLTEIFKVKLSKESVFDCIAKLAGSAGIRRLGFEERHLEVAAYRRFKRLLGKVKFIPTKGLVEGLRVIKEPAELVKIKRAVEIAAQALRYIRRFIRPGIREIEIAAELERFIRYQGAGAASFETIVASGKNTAFPHHLTGKRRLEKRDCLFIDIGVDYQGYKSDLTRTLFLGKIPSQLSRIYEIVRKAQLQAIERIKPGARIEEIDRTARQYIAKCGYGGFFAHNLGHGIGLEVHEQPAISSTEKGLLQAGMVFTVEPAVYLPGKFGVRIEDDILVTQRGYEVLSHGLDK
ncbi:M24 family metallopeptidase [Candidatus Omnitrophota bacterium]